MTPSIGSARQFWDHVADPDYQDFKANPTDIRAAFHSALSLFHQADWVLEQHGATSAGVLGQNTLSHFNAELTRRCADFGLLRDVANAHKHFRLNRGDPVVTSATQVSVGTPTWGESHWGELPTDGASSILIEISPTEERHFWKVAQNVHEMWQDLFQTGGW